MGEMPDPSDAQLLRAYVESGQETAFREIVTRHRHWRIPTGFRPKAQGCEERATLGNRPRNVTTAMRLRPKSHAPYEIGFATTALRLGKICFTTTQGSSFLATLGWRTQSLWD
jgi:hypothetical protein